MAPRRTEKRTPAPMPDVIDSARTVAVIGTVLALGAAAMGLTSALGGGGSIYLAGAQAVPAGAYALIAGAIAGCYALLFVTLGRRGPQSGVALLLGALLASHGLLAILTAAAASAWPIIFGVLLPARLCWLGRDWLRV